jgi:predicted nucleic acid-binding protein
VTILVDTSVWIDLFSNRTTRETSKGRSLIETGKRVVVGDLILLEVLQGTRDARDYARKLALLDAFDPLVIVDRQVVLEAARNYQLLRSLGITIRKTIDTLIATRCIRDDIPLLYSDRDFDPFVLHLGLRSALELPGVH